MYRVAISVLLAASVLAFLPEGHGRQLQQTSLVGCLSALPAEGLVLSSARSGKVYALQGNLTLLLAHQLQQRRRSSRTYSRGSVTLRFMRGSSRRPAIHSNGSQAHPFIDFNGKLHHSFARLPARIDWEVPPRVDYIDPFCIGS